MKVKNKESGGERKADFYYCYGACARGRAHVRGWEMYAGGARGARIY